MSAQPRSLVGQVVAITGGARGIGRATATTLVREGAKVAIGDLDQAAAEQTATEIGGGTIGLALDVTDLASFEAYIDAVEAKLGPVDVIINNAGIMLLGDFFDEDLNLSRRQNEINLWGVLIGSQLAGKRFRRRGRGHIVNIASVAGKSGYPGGATYCATKHAVVGLSESMRGELKDSGVEVSCVMPSLVNTELASGVGSARFVKNVDPQDVANEIVDALKQPRFDVYVPRSNGPLLKGMSVMPRGLQDRATALFKADKVLTDVNDQARLAYQERATKGVEAGSSSPKLGSGDDF
jgi:NAD(P)-dependent dehydrogenase (short-subunit alcohol dehydrogenase family)